MAGFGVIRMPDRTLSPAGAIVRRLTVAVLALGVTVLVVYLGRDGYRDVNGDGVSLLDSVYYATVSLSTTGYGDITPASESARLINIVVVTPLRLVFLIVLVGTTMELLTDRSRHAFKVQRWRSRVRNHVVVVGYGTKGSAAADTMLGDGADPASIVVVDLDPERLKLASSRGLVTVSGNATRAEVLRTAGVPRAASIVVAPSRDDTAVLVTLTARELAPTATIVASLILFQGINTDNPINTISLLVGFVVIFIGMHLLELSRKPAVTGHNALEHGILNPRLSLQGRASIDGWPAASTVTSSPGLHFGHAHHTSRTALFDVLEDAPNGSAHAVGLQSLHEDVEDDELEAATERTRLRAEERRSRSHTASPTGSSDDPWRS